MYRVGATWALYRRSQTFSGFKGTAIVVSLPGTPASVQWNLLLRRTALQNPFLWVQKLILPVEWHCYLLLVMPLQWNPYMRIQGRFLWSFSGIYILTDDTIVLFSHEENCSSAPINTTLRRIEGKPSKSGFFFLRRPLRALKPGVTSCASPVSSCIFVVKSANLGSLSKCGGPSSFFMQLSHD